MTQGDPPRHTLSRCDNRVTDTVTNTVTLESRRISAVTLVPVPEPVFTYLPLTPNLTLWSPRFCPQKSRSLANVMPELERTNGAKTSTETGPT